MRSTHARKLYVIRISEDGYGSGSFANGWSMQIRPNDINSYLVEWGMLFMKTPAWKEYHESIVVGLDNLLELADYISSLEYWGRLCPYCDPDSKNYSAYSPCNHGEDDRRWVEFKGWEYRTERYNPDDNTWGEEWVGR